MNVRLHVALNQFFHVYRLVCPFLICTIFSAPIPIVVLILLPYFVPLLLTWLVPVECLSRGCTGRMQSTNERLSFWSVILIYKCDTCGKVHREEIFNPDFEITVEFS